MEKDKILLHVITEENLTCFLTQATQTNTPKMEISDQSNPTRGWTQPMSMSAVSVYRPNKSTIVEQRITEPRMILHSVEIMLSAK